MKLLIGIAGGSGSGKTTLAKTIAKELGQENVLLISLDKYYKDLSHLPLSERHKANFDVPDSIDWPLLREQLAKLISAASIEAPVYSFSEHTRTGYETIQPKEVIIIESIFALSDPELCKLMNFRFFVDTPSDIRLTRRLKRDISERGRTFDSVIDQWITTVRPAHESFIGPSARQAHLIIPEDPEAGMRSVAVRIIKHTVNDFLNGSQ